MMPYLIEIQKLVQDPLPVSEAELSHWAEQLLAEYCDTAELNIRLVDPAEIQALNWQYRQKNKSTNVLAFPMQLPQGITLEMPPLGDLILCPEVLAQESIDWEQPLIDHWAHILIHGILHLLGYDHIEAEDEAKMQAEEIRLLNKLGFANPYAEQEDE